MIDVRTLSPLDLVTLSSTLSLDELYAYENQLADLFRVNMFREVTQSVRAYIHKTSLPYAIGQEELASSNYSRMLKKIWSTEEHMILTLDGFRKAVMPTGNMHPHFMVVEDVPPKMQIHDTDKHRRAFMY